MRKKLTHSFCCCCCCSIRYIHSNLWEVNDSHSHTANKNKSGLAYILCPFVTAVTFSLFDLCKVLRSRCSLLNHVVSPSEKSHLTPPIRFKSSFDIYLLLQNFHNLLLTQRSANCFYKGPNSRYFRLCGLVSISVKSTLPLKYENSHGWRNACGCIQYNFTERGSGLDWADSPI